MVHRSGYVQVVVPPAISQVRLSREAGLCLHLRAGWSARPGGEGGGERDIELRGERLPAPAHRLAERGRGGHTRAGQEGELKIWILSASGKTVKQARATGPNTLYQVAVLERARLRLDKISRLNMGDYLCVASNGIPPSASSRFSVRVQCTLLCNAIDFFFVEFLTGYGVSVPPMFWIPSQREAVWAGQPSVTIECHSEAFPKSINYWVNNKGAMLTSSISC